MTQDEIIEITRQAGGFSPTPEFLETFAKLVRNHYSYTHAHLWLTRIEGAVKAEREECAKACEGHDLWGPLAAKTIRARGDA